jgi:hypothetical protein
VVKPSSPGGIFPLGLGRQGEALTGHFTEP